MIYAYIRVSTTQQDTEKQKFELFNLAYSKTLKIDEFIEETVSGSKPYKERLLGNLIQKLKKDDIILITELSRFGRSLLEIMEIMSQLMQKDVKVYVAKGGMEIGKNIQSKVLAFAFGLAAEIERELISSRTREALVKLKSEGKILGRPKGALSKSKLDGKEKEIDYYLSKQISIKSICKLLDVPPTTFYGFCKNRAINLKKYKKF
ncbi:MAG: recombinase family protein [Candidatus Sericytochromatia bacterium]